MVRSLLERCSTCSVMREGGREGSRIKLCCLLLSSFAFLPSTTTGQDTTSLSFCVPHGGGRSREFVLPGSSTSSSQHGGCGVLGASVLEGAFREGTLLTGEPHSSSAPLRLELLDMSGVAVALTCGVRPTDLRAHCGSGGRQAGAKVLELFGEQDEQAESPAPGPSFGPATRDGMPTSRLAAHRERLYDARWPLGPPDALEILPAPLDDANGLAGGGPYSLHTLHHAEYETPPSALLFALSTGGLSAARRGSDGGGGKGVRPMPPPPAVPALWPILVARMAPMQWQSQLLQFTLNFRQFAVRATPLADHHREVRRWATARRRRRRQQQQQQQQRLAGFGGDAGGSGGSIVRTAVFGHRLHAWVNLTFAVTPLRASRHGNDMEAAAQEIWVSLKNLLLSLPACNPSYSRHRGPHRRRHHNHYSEETGRHHRHHEQEKDGNSDSDKARNAKEEEEEEEEEEKTEQDPKDQRPSSTAPPAATAAPARNGPGDAFARRHPHTQFAALLWQRGSQSGRIHIFDRHSCHPFCALPGVRGNASAVGGEERGGAGSTRRRSFGLRGLYHIVNSWCTRLAGDGDSGDGGTGGGGGGGGTTKEGPRRHHGHLPVRPSDATVLSVQVERALRPVDLDDKQLRGLGLAAATLPRRRSRAHSRSNPPPNHSRPDTGGPGVTTADNVTESGVDPTDGSNNTAAEPKEPRRSGGNVQPDGDGDGAAGESRQGGGDHHNRGYADDSGDSGSISGDDRSRMSSRSVGGDGGGSGGSGGSDGGVVGAITGTVEAALRAMVQAGWVPPEPPPKRDRDDDGENQADGGDLPYEELEKRRRARPPLPEVCQAPGGQSATDLIVHRLAAASVLCWERRIGTCRRLLDQQRTGKVPGHDDGGDRDSGTASWPATPSKKTADRRSSGWKNKKNATRGSSGDNKGSAVNGRSPFSDFQHRRLSYQHHADPRHYRNRGYDWGGGRTGLRVAAIVQAQVLAFEGEGGVSGDSGGGDRGGGAGGQGGNPQSRSSPPSVSSTQGFHDKPGSAVVITEAVAEEAVSLLRPYLAVLGRTAAQFRGAGGGLVGQWNDADNNLGTFDAGDRAGVATRPASALDPSERSDVAGERAARGKGGRTDTSTDNIDDGDRERGGDVGIDAALRWRSDPNLEPEQVARLAELAGLVPLAESPSWPLSAWRPVEFQATSCLRMETPALGTVVFGANCAFFGTLLAWAASLLCAYLLCGWAVLRYHRRGTIALPANVRVLRVPLQLYCLYLWPLPREQRDGPARQQQQQQQQQQQHHALRGQPQGRPRPQGQPPEMLQQPLPRQSPTVEGLLPPSSGGDTVLRRQLQQTGPYRAIDSAIPAPATEAEMLIAADGIAGDGAGVPVFPVPPRAAGDAAEEAVAEDGIAQVGATRTPGSAPQSTGVISTRRKLRRGAASSTLRAGGGDGSGGIGGGGGGVWSALRRRSVGAFSAFPRRRTSPSVASAGATADVSTAGNASYCEQKAALSRDAVVATLTDIRLHPAAAAPAAPIAPTTTATASNVCGAHSQPAGGKRNSLGGKGDASGLRP